MFFQKKQVLNIDLFLKQRFKYLIQKKLQVLDHQKKTLSKMQHQNF